MKPQQSSRRAWIFWLSVAKFADAFTVTTFNILAPVHKSMGSSNQRESERESWWRPRAQAVAEYISENLASSDVVLLQEWWFDEKFSSVFDSITGDIFDRVAECRPFDDADLYTYLKQHDSHGLLREDGMCCLINKKGKLDLVKSEKVMTGPQRIAQIIQCKEKTSDGTSGSPGRDVFLANTHLSFPKDEDSRKNDRRQAYEINLIRRALSKASSRSMQASSRAAAADSDNETLEIICGDFNSEPNGFAATQLETRDFVNCASAKAEQMGVTHFTHRGEERSVDHIFVRLTKHSPPTFSLKAEDFSQLLQSENVIAGKRSISNNEASKSSRRGALSIGYQDPLSLGYIDTKGTQILDVRRANIRIRGRGVISDHTPVTAQLRWPKFRSVGHLSDPFLLPLDPLSYPFAS